MFEWVWQPSRLVYMSGTVSVGAVFSPAYPGGNWRWRFWINGRLSPEEGKAVSELKAREVVESRFATFLDRAALKPSVGSEARS